jgi:hypothetical protein
MQVTGLKKMKGNGGGERPASFTAIVPYQYNFIP